MGGFWQDPLFSLRKIGELPWELAALCPDGPRGPLPQLVVVGGPEPGTGDGVLLGDDELRPREGVVRRSGAHSDFLHEGAVWECGVHWRTLCIPDANQDSKKTQTAQPWAQKRSPPPFDELAAPPPL